MPVINGEARFAYLFKPDTKFTPKYCIDLVVDKKTYDEMTKLGTGGLQEKDGEYIIKFKTLAAFADGTAKPHPDVFGPDGKTPFTQEVGNGSEVRVLYSVHEYSSYGGGKTLILEKVQVVKHVPYEKKDSFEFDAVDVPATEDSSDNPFA